MKRVQSVLVLELLCITIFLSSLGCKKESKSSSSSAVKAGKYTIIDTRTDQASRSRAKQNVEDALNRYSDIHCMTGLWSYNAPAILSAVKDAGKTGQIKIIGFDEEADTIQGIKDGHIEATVVQQPFEFGYISVKLLAALARNDNSMIPPTKIIDVPVKVVDIDNVNGFWTGIEKMLKEKNVSPPANPQQVNVALISNATADFWKIARKGVNKAEKEFNAACDFLMPPNGTSEEQQRMLESLIAKGTSGLAISLVDPANQTQMINNAATQMNIITQDSDAPNSNRLCYVGTNNYQAGREAGKLIKKALPEGGNIMLFVGSMDAQNAIDRRQGIIDELSDKPMP